MQLDATCIDGETDSHKQATPEWQHVAKQRIHCAKLRLNHFAFSMPAEMPDELLDYLDPFLPPSLRALHRQIHATTLQDMHATKHPESDTTTQQHLLATRQNPPDHTTKHDAGMSPDTEHPRSRTETQTGRVISQPGMEQVMSSTDTQTELASLHTDMEPARSDSDAQTRPDSNDDNCALLTQLIAENDLHHMNLSDLRAQRQQLQQEVETHSRVLSLLESQPGSGQSSFHASIEAADSNAELGVPNSSPSYVGDFETILETDSSDSDSTNSSNRINRASGVNTRGKSTVRHSTVAVPVSTPDGSVSAAGTKQNPE